MAKHIIRTTINSRSTCVFGKSLLRIKSGRLFQCTWNEHIFSTLFYVKAGVIFLWGSFFVMSNKLKKNLTLGSFFFKNNQFFFSWRVDSLRRKMTPGQYSAGVIIPLYTGIHTYLYCYKFSWAGSLLFNEKINTCLIHKWKIYTSRFFVTWLLFAVLHIFQFYLRLSFRPRPCFHPLQEAQLTTLPIVKNTGYNFLKINFSLIHKGGDCLLNYSDLNSPKGAGMFCISSSAKLCLSTTLFL